MSDETTTPQVWTYKCKPLAANWATGKQLDAAAAANALEALINQGAGSGWEFYATEQFTVENQPGCLAALFGGKPTSMIQVVVIFRRPT